MRYEKYIFTVLHVVVTTIGAQWASDHKTLINDDSEPWWQDSSWHSDAGNTWQSIPTQTHYDGGAYNSGRDQWQSSHWTPIDSGSGMYGGKAVYDPYAQWGGDNRRNPYGSTVESSGGFQPAGWGYDDEDSYYGSGADVWSYDYGDSWYDNNPIIYDSGRDQGSPFDQIDTNIPPPPSIPTVHGNDNKQDSWWIEPDTNVNAPLYTPEPATLPPWYDPIGRPVTTPSITTTTTTTTTTPTTTTRWYPPPTTTAFVYTTTRRTTTTTRRPVYWETTTPRAPIYWETTTTPARESDNSGVSIYDTQPKSSGDTLKERLAALFFKPGILAAVIGGAVVGLIAAILLVFFIVYRMRKRDEGSYALEEPKSPSYGYAYHKAPTKEFYA